VKIILFGFIAIAVVTAFSIVSCSVGGRFTLTDIPPEYNGKYAVIYYAKVYYTNEAGDIKDSKITLFGVQNVGGSPPQSATLPRISNGKVTIPMWQSSRVFKRYSGDDTVGLKFGIVETLNFSEDSIAIHLFQDVTFKNGSAVKTWSDGFEPQR